MAGYKKSGVSFHSSHVSCWGKMYGLYVLPLLKRSTKSGMNIIKFEVARIWHYFNFKQSVVDNKGGSENL
jgi:hypothetical protein